MLTLLYLGVILSGAQRSRFSHSGECIHPTPFNSVYQIGQSHARQAQSL